MVAERDPRIEAAERAHKALVEFLRRWVEVDGVAYEVVHFKNRTGRTRGTAAVGQITLDALDECAQQLQWLKEQASKAGLEGPVMKFDGCGNVFMHWWLSSV